MKAVITILDCFKAVFPTLQGQLLLIFHNKAFI